MRKLLVLLSFFISVHAISQTKKALPLEEALQNKKVLLEATGNPESTHYQQPLLLHLENPLSDPITLQISNGHIFHAEEEGIQDLIITKEELITLGGREQKTVPINAMCIEKNNSASYEDTPYRLGEMAKGDLAKLSREIEKRGLQGSVGQQAIWTLTDNQDLNSIIGFDEESALDLKNFVAELKGIPVPEYLPEELETYRRTNKVNRATEGYFNYSFSKPRAVTIALFDSENRLIREIYNNPNETPEKHRVDFSFTMEMDRTQTYYVHLLADNKIQLTLTMKGRNG